VKFSAVVSPFDWAWYYGGWGKASAHWVLDRLHWAGIRRVYLRVRQCQCYYPSRVDMPGIHFWTPENCVAEGSWGTKGHEWQWWPQAYDFRTYDAPRLFIDRAHELGMEVYAWLEQAEAHGHGWESRFSREHPELLTRNREGQVVNGNLSFAYPEAIEFRLAILREILEYRFDGVAIDFQKGGDHRIPRVDSDGVYYAHYDAPVVESFQQATGRDPFAIANDDPEWVQHRANYVTDFLRQARALHQQLHPEQEFGVMGIPKGKPLPAKNELKGLRHSQASNAAAPAASALAGNLEDHHAWTAEKLVDFLIVTPLPEQTTPFDPAAYVALLRDAKAQIAGPCRLGLWQVMWGAQSPRVREVVDAAATLAAGEGVDETVFFQAISFEDARWQKQEVTWDALRAAIAAQQPSLTHSANAV
jgi:hypothetical protein